MNLRKKLEELTQEARWDDTQVEVDAILALFRSACEEAKPKEKTLEDMQPINPITGEKMCAYTINVSNFYNQALSDYHDALKEATK